MAITLKDVLSVAGALVWCAGAAGLNRALGRRRLPLTSLIAGLASAAAAYFEFPGRPLRVAVAGVVGALAIFLLYRKSKQDEGDEAG